MIYKDDHEIVNRLFDAGQIDIYGNPRNINLEDQMANNSIL
jgi:hypothetical protein